MNILSLDGDGVYGAHTAVVLQRLGQSVVDRADVFAGTSIGGMIALALAAGVSVDRCVDVCSDARSFFTREPRRVAQFIAGKSAKYDNEGRRKKMTELFGGRKIKSLRRWIVIQCMDVNTEPMWSSKVITNSDDQMTLVDAALATSAASTFFPCVGHLTDGGMVANNPSMTAVAHCFKSLGYMKLLSIGRAYPELRNCEWNWDTGWREVMDVINMLRTGNQTLVDDQCRQILGDRYHRHLGIVPRELGMRLDDHAKVPAIMDWARGLDLTATEEWVKTHW